MNGLEQLTRCGPTASPGDRCDAILVKPLPILLEPST